MLPSEDKRRTGRSPRWRRYVSALAFGEEVAELFFFGLQIVFRVLAWSDFAGNSLGHSDSGPFQRSNLVRVVGKQTHLLNAERLQNFHRQLEFPMIGFEA